MNEYKCPQEECEKTFYRKSEQDKVDKDKSGDLEETVEDEFKFYLPLNNPNWEV